MGYIQDRSPLHHRTRTYKYIHTYNAVKTFQWSKFAPKVFRTVGGNPRMFEPGPYSPLMLAGNVNTTTFHLVNMNIDMRACPIRPLTRCPPWFSFLWGSPFSSLRRTPLERLHIYPSFVFFWAQSSPIPAPTHPSFSLSVALSFLFFSIWLSQTQTHTNKQSSEAVLISVSF